MLAQNRNSFLDASNMGHPLKNGNMLLSSIASNKAMVFFFLFTHRNCFIFFNTQDNICPSGNFFCPPSQQSNSKSLISIMIQMPVNQKKNYLGEAVYHSIISVE